MNHKARAEHTLRRVIAPHHHKSDLFALLSLAFSDQLRRVEREAWRSAIRKAANVVGDHVGGARHPVFQAVLALEKSR